MNVKTEGFWYLEKDEGIDISDVDILACILTQPNKVRSYLTRLNGLHLCAIKIYPGCKRI